MRGGLNLSFEGKGLLFLALGLIPIFLESICATVLTKYIFELNWYISIPNGILLSALSPGVVVPKVLILMENKYGVKKGIPQTMLAACSIDNLIGVLMFTTFVT